MEKDNLSELPKGWLWTNVGEISVRIHYGYTASATDIPTGTKLLRITDIQNNSVKWDSVPYCNIDDSEEQKYLLSDGDLVFARTGATVGKSFLIEGWIPKAVFASYLIRIFLAEEIGRKFVYYFFQSHFYWIQINTGQVGIGQPHVNAQILSQVCIPLAPLNEQRRIVAKLEKLLAKVDTCKERLDKIPGILKRFRQSVLSAACSGRLTADWRENNPDVEPADELLKRIYEQRNNPGKNKEILVDNIEDQDIPETWICVQFGSLIGELKNGISPSPNMEPPGTPVLRISAVRGGKLDLSDVRYLLDADKFTQTYALQEKDLIFTRYNGTLDLVGACSMVRDLGEKTILYPDKLMRVRFDHELIESGYAEIFFQNPIVRNKITAKSKSSAGQNGVSGQDIKNQLFTMPPLAEQQEIVNRVQILFKTADRIEQRYQKARTYIDQLTQSILAKAFRGELVPQDPNDEPASVLLERIRAERENRENVAKTAKKPAANKKQRSKKAQPQLEPKPQLEPTPQLEPIQLELPLFE